MAEVWEAHDDVLARSVAIKTLLPHLAADEAFRERFRREAISAARLSHPNIVATYDTGEDDDGVPYIVMELVRGRTLREELNDGAMPLGRAIGIAIAVADALAVAHAAEIVHRDVKPANVLLGEDGSVKVSDFGIARAANLEGTDLTQPGALLGTARYLAPEQVEGKEIDGRVDVYALGVLLFELVTGRVPFDGDSAVATAMARLHNDPPRPRQVRAGIPRSVEEVVLKAMARDPELRYQSADALAGALRGLSVADDATAAIVREPTPPAGSPAAFPRSERRWLVPALVIMAVAAGLVAVGVMLRQSDVGQDLFDRTPANQAATFAAITRITTFDPEGEDGSENEEGVARAYDLDVASRWASDVYKSRDFGGLKDGLGLVVELDEETAVRRVLVESPTTGWDAEVYVADQAGTDLDDWGTPVAEEVGITGRGAFDVVGREGRFVLLWFTRLGDNNRVEVANLVVEK